MQQQELRNKLASYKLPFESLVFCDAIGTGGFGKVYEGTCNGQICAIKEIKYGDSPNADQIYQEFLNESYLMVTLYHYNIVDFMGWTTGELEGRVYVVMELAPFTLAKILKTTKPDYAYPTKIDKEKLPILTNMMKLQIATDIAEGMNYLHTRDPPVIHADLKSPNVLLDAAMTSKICDFGIAKVFKKNLDLGGIAGTEGWMAPEVYQSDMTYPTKIDVYSYGIVLYEIITHEIPYATILDPAQIMQLTLSGQRPVIANEEQIRASDTIMNELITLFYSCTELDPQKRPSFSDITKILFFPIPGRVEYKVDQNAEKDIQTFNKIQQVIDCVCDEVLHTPLERKSSLTKIVSPPPQKISKTLPTMMDGQFRIIVPATRSLRPPLVHVSPGTYIENLTLVKNLEIKAEGKVIIEPQDREKPVVTMSNCGGATFRNCIFPSGNVLVTGVDSRSHFKDCQFENVQVQICDKSDPFITRCTFQNCEITISDLETRSTLFKNNITGRIVIANGARTVLQECTIHDAERGIEIGSQCRTYVEQCEITKCKSGIFIGKGGDPMIEYCKIYGNGIGIETDEEAVGLLRKNQVSGNEVDFKIADSATTWNEDLLFQTGTTSDDDEDW